MPQGNVLLPMQLLSHQLSRLLGRQYSQLLACIHALNVDEHQPALVVDEHASALAELHELMEKYPSKDAVLRTALVHCQESCLPAYRFADDKEPLSRLLNAQSQVQAIRDVVSRSHWSMRYRALDCLDVISQAYVKAGVDFEAGVEAPERLIPYQNRSSLALLGEGYYHVPVAIARQLMCIDEKGEKVKRNQAGTHAVCAANGVHYKPNIDIEVPINPGKEYAVSSLMQLIAGQALAAAPSTLLSIEHIPVVKADRSSTMGGLVQGGLTITGMCFQDFLECREAISLWQLRLPGLSVKTLVEDVKSDFVLALEVAKKHYPTVFAVVDMENQTQRMELSEAFRLAFEQLCEGMLGEAQLLDIQKSAGRPEGNRCNAFRGLFEGFLNAGGTIDELRALLGVLCQYPNLMAEQTIADILLQIKYSKRLFELFPNVSIDEALEVLPELLTDAYLDTESISALWIGLLLSLPCDAKFDNFMLQLEYNDKQQLQTCRIVSIDNDLSLKMPFRINEERKASLEIKNTLILLPEIMQQPLHPKVRERFLSTSATSQWLTWLCLLTRRDADYQAWQTHGTVSQQALAEIDIPVQLPEQVFLFIRSQWQALHQLLQANFHVTLGQCLSKLYPLVDMAYQGLQSNVLISLLKQQKYLYDIFGMSGSCPLEKLITQHWSDKLVQSQCDVRSHYRLQLHSALPGGHIEKAESGFIYLDEATRTYVVRGEGDLVYQGDLPAEINLSRLRNTLMEIGLEEKKQKLHDSVLAVTGKRGHTPSPLLSVATYCHQEIKLINWAIIPVYEQWPIVEALSLLPSLTLSDWQGATEQVINADDLQRWLVEAIKKGAPLVAQRLLELGASASQADKNGQTPLHHFSIYYLHYDDAKTTSMMAEVLLSHHSSQPDAYNGRGYTPLLQWISALPEPTHLTSQQYTSAQALLDAFVYWGANLEAKDAQRHETVLDKAARPESRKPTWFITLIEKGAGLHARGDHIVDCLDNCPGALLQRPGAREAIQQLQMCNLSMQWHISQQIWQVVPQKNSVPISVPIKGIYAGDVHLPAAIAAKLVDEKHCFHTEGAIDYGRRVVKRIRHQKIDWYVKEYPEMPGIEYAVGLFGRMLLGEHTAPSELFAFTDVKKQRYPVLISQTVPGENLHTILSSPAQHHKLDQLHPRSTSEQIILAMLTNPEDGKPDNYQLMPMSAIDKYERNDASIVQQALPKNTQYRIVGVDNDHAFVRPVLQREQRRALQVKCVLFCLDEMRKPVHPSVRQRLLNVTLHGVLQANGIVEAGGFLDEWLQKLEEHHARAMSLFDKKTRERLFKQSKLNFIKSFAGLERERLPVVVSVPFRMTAITELFDRFKTLQRLLREQPTITHLQLLKAMTPSLGIRYEVAFNQYPRPEFIRERFHNIAHAHYSTAIAGRYNTLTTSKQALEAMGFDDVAQQTLLEDDRNSNRRSHTPQFARQELVQAIRESAQVQHVTERLLEEDPVSFRQLLSTIVKQRIVNQLDFTRIMLPGGKSPDFRKQRWLVDVIKQAAIAFQSLRIEHCAVLTDDDVAVLLKQSPDIERLTLHDCPNITEKTIDHIRQYTQHTQQGEQQQIIKLSALTTLTLTRLPNMRVFGSKENPVSLVQVRRINISDNLQLQGAYIQGAQLTRVSVQRNQAMNTIHIDAPKLTQLSAANSRNLVDCFINSTQAMNLDIENCFQLQDVSERNNSVLLEAVEQGDLTNIDRLLTQGMLLTVASNTVLLMAAKYGQVKALARLLEHYPDRMNLGTENSYGVTLLLVAMTHRKHEVIKYLLQRYPDISIDEHTMAAEIEKQPGLKEIQKENGMALMKAASRGNIEKIILLLRQGVSLCIKDPDGYTLCYMALSLAAKNSQVHIIDYFLEQHLDKVATLENRKGITPLRAMIMDAQPEVLEHVLTRYSDKINLSDRDKLGYTTLLFLVRNGRVKTIDYLLRYYPEKVSLSEKDNEGKTALFVAAEFGKVEVIKYLLEYYSDKISLSEVDKDGLNILLVAMLSNQEEVVDYLLQRFPDEVSIDEYILEEAVEKKSGKQKEGLKLVQKYINLQLLGAVQKGDNTEITKLLRQGASLTSKYKSLEETLKAKIPLIFAVYGGQLETVKYLLESYPSKIDLDEKDDNGKTMLLFAAERGQTQIIEYLLKCHSDKINLYERDSNGLNILLVAMLHNQKEVIDYLLKHYPEEISINEDELEEAIKRQPILRKIQNRNIDALLKAIACENVQEVTRLLHQGTALRTSKSDISLSLPIIGEHIKVIDHLLQKHPDKVNLSEKDSQGRTALLLAAANGKVEIFDYLLTQYSTEVSLSDKDISGSTALSLAAKGSYVSMVMYLLKNHLNKIDLFEKDGDGLTMIQIAILYSQLEVINYLQKHFPDELVTSEKTLADIIEEKPHFRKIWEDSRNSVLLKAAEQGDIGGIAQLLRRCQSISLKDSEGNTLLLIAAIKGQIEIIDFLLENYPDKISLAERNSSGETALLLAVRYRRIDVIDHLLKRYPKEVSLSDKSKCRSFILLFYAHDTKVIDHLLKHYPDQVSLAERNYLGRTVLLEAAYHGEIQLIDFLLAHYPDKVSLSDRDDNGRTALLLMAEGGQAKAIKHLLQHYPNQVSIHEKDNDGLTALLVSVIRVRGRGVTDYLLRHYSSKVNLDEELMAAVATVKSRVVAFKLLDLAVKYDQSGAVNCLLERYPDILSLSKKKEVISMSEFQLMGVLFFCRREIITDYLLEHFPDKVNFVEKDPNGRTVLLRAAYGVEFRTISRMLEYHRDRINLQEKDNDGLNVLLLAMLRHQKFYQSKQKEVIEYLLQYYPDEVSISEEILTEVAEKNPELKKIQEGNNLALLEAAKRGDNKIIKRLLQQGASITVTDLEGNTLLLLAAIHGQVKTIDYLLEHYPDKVSLTERNNDGQTAFLIAAKYSVLGVISHLLERYHDELGLTEKDKYGRTALFLAVEKGERGRQGMKDDLQSLVVINMLLGHFLEKMVDLDEENNVGLTVLSIALFNLKNGFGFFAIQCLLERFYLKKMGSLEETTEKIYRSIERQPLCSPIWNNQKFLQVLVLIMQEDNVEASKMVESILINYAFSPDKLHEEILPLIFKYGRADTIDYLLEQQHLDRLSLARRYNGKNGLLLAAQYGKVEIIEYLLKYYPSEMSLADRDDSGNTMLLLAAIHGKVEVISYLLEHHLERVSLHEKNNDGSNILLVAMSVGQTEVIDYLLQHYSVEVSITPVALAKATEKNPSLKKVQEENNLALLESAKCGDIKNAISLFQQGAFLLTKDLSGNTLLLIAAGSGQIKFVEFLLKYHLDKFSLYEKNYAECTPLLLAAANGQVSMIDYLLQHHSDKVSLDDRNSYGQTVLLLAACGRVSVIDYLLQHYPDRTKLGEKDSNGLTALSYAAYYGHTHILEYLRQRFESQINWEEKSYHGLTALQYAAMGQHEETVNYLLSIQYDIDRNQEETKLDLYEVISFRQQEAIFRLSQQPLFNVSAVDQQGNTYLHCAAGFATVKVFECLLTLLKEDKKISISKLVVTPNAFGLTPLHLAVGRPGTKILQILLTYCPDITLHPKDKQGVTPLGRALYYGFEDSARLLLASVGEVLDLSYGNVTSCMEVATMCVALEGNDTVKVVDLTSNTLSKDAIDILNQFKTDLKSKVLFITNESDDVLKEKDPAGRNMLLLAATNGEIKIIEHLLRCYPDKFLNDRDYHGHTALLLAAANGQIKVIDYLLQHHSDKISLDDRNFYGQTVLLLAAYCGHVSIIDYLLQHYPDKVNLGEGDGNGLTALSYAAYHGYAYILEYLRQRFERQIDWEERCYHGLMAIQYAAMGICQKMENHLLSIQCQETVNYLLSIQYDIDRHEEETKLSLHEVISFREQEALSRLSQQPSFDVSAMDQQGNTYLHCAVGFGTIKIFKRVLVLLSEDKVADISELVVTPNHFGLTPLHLAVGRPDTTILRELLIYFPDITKHPRDKQGFTPLERALYYGFGSHAGLLLSGVKETLDLSNGSITSWLEIYTLLEALRDNEAVTIVDLTGNLLSKEAISCLEKSVVDSRSRLIIRLSDRVLTSLSVPQTFIVPDEKKEIIIQSEESVPGASAVSSTPVLINPAVVQQSMFVQSPSAEIVLESEEENDSSMGTVGELDFCTHSSSVSVEMSESEQLPPISSAKVEYQEESQFVT